MRISVKLPVFFTILLFSVTATAQINLSTANTLSADILKVIDDYPHHFSHIIGEMIVENPQSTDYRCNFTVNGAEECTITKYSGKSKPVSSWQAVMLTTESFAEARSKFRSLYSQINNLSVRSMQLKGVYEAPAEEKKFTSVLFTFTPTDESLKKLRVELVLEAEQMEWKIRLLVYDRDRNDGEKGPAVE